ncbi:putative lipoprotein [Myxococcus hansupus]|uniref:Putative lipoprotein n=1 Tax=Pseudomyxococcus hansupus TaxID=1297742 RepID=A0A0H4X143_9BACT|nr:putative lipoprotein [Myxococcus hansupus]
MGDRVSYAFSASQGPSPEGGDTARTVEGRLTLDVVSVQAPWVWVRVAYTDAAGGALPSTRLAKDLVVPVRSDETRPLDVPHSGTASAESPSLAGRTWEALRYVSDQRPVDGPLRSRVYANDSGPLYLTRGLLEATVETAGFRTPGRIQLSLQELNEGSPATRTPVPALERPLGPGAYYDRKVDIAPTHEVARVCITAERGYVLRTEGPVGAGGAPCSDFSQAEPEPLEDLLMSLPWEVLSSGDWPPVGASSARVTFTAGSRSVPAVTEQRPEDVDGTQHVFSETYAADPWASELAGMPYEARFQPLASGTERTGAGGKRESVGETRMVNWGPWLGVQ